MGFLPRSAHSRSVNTDDCSLLRASRPSLMCCCVTSCTRLHAHLKAAAFLTKTLSLSLSCTCALALFVRGLSPAVWQHHTSLFGLSFMKGYRCSNEAGNLILNCCTILPTRILPQIRSALPRSCLPPLKPHRSKDGGERKNLHFSTRERGPT